MRDPPACTSKPRPGYRVQTWVDSKQEQGLAVETCRSGSSGSSSNDHRKQQSESQPYRMNPNRTSDNRTRSVAISRAAPMTLLRRPSGSSGPSKIRKASKLPQEFSAVASRMADSSFSFPPPPCPSTRKAHPGPKTAEPCACLQEISSQHGQGLKGLKGLWGGSYSSSPGHRNERR